VLAIRLVGGVNVWSSSQDKTIVIWDRNSFKVIKTVKMKEVVNCLEIVGRVIYCGMANGEIRVLTPNAKQCNELNVKSPVNCILYLKPYIWIGVENDILIFEENSLLKQTTAIGHRGMVHCLASVGNCVWSCGSDKTIRVWSLKGEPMRVIEGHSGRVFLICQVGDNHVWSCSWDKTIIIWNKDNFAFLRELKGVHNDAVSWISPIVLKGLAKDVWSCSWDGSLALWRYSQAQHCTISSGNTIVRQGFLWKQGGEFKSWKMRWFMLFSNGTLSYYDSQAAAEPINTVTLKDCPIRENPISINSKDTRRYSFSIETSEARGKIAKRTYLMACESKDEMDGWIRSLKAVIE